MRLWAGVSAISAALQRKTFTFVKSQYCFPNIYVLLVGPPGVGKGNAMKKVGAWLKEIEEIHMSPDGLTKRSFYSTMEQARCEDLDFSESINVVDALQDGHHSLTAFIEELGVFLHAGDNDFIYVLCHVYDTPLQFHYKTETAGENFMQNVYFSMLSAVTPKGLKDIFTDQALELGISARTVIVYSDEKIDVEIFGSSSKDEALEKDLKTDLLRINQIKGEYIFDNDAAQELVAWANQGFPPIPKDSRFEHYNARRFVQLVKLCMICAASRRNETIILKEDFVQAKSFLLEAERHMPKAVETIGSNPYVDQQRMAVRIVSTVWKTLNRGTSEAELRAQLSKDMDPRYSDMVYNDLSSAGWVDVTGKAPNRIFYPKGMIKEAYNESTKKDPADKGSS